MFGFRRHANESIHSIRPVSDIFSDIITVYGMDYVISGPVWEYYAGDSWKEGMIQKSGRTDFAVSSEKPLSTLHRSL